LLGGTARPGYAAYDPTGPEEVSTASAAPSGSGFQLSLYGLFGILLAACEGLEVNLLGLSLGVDPVRPALKLPALGRLGMAGL
jgi:hypothetical protein